MLASILGRLVEADAPNPGEIGGGILVKKRRRRRRKNRSNPDSVAVEEGGAQLTLDSVAAAVVDGAMDSEAANGSGTEAGDQEAAEQDAAVGEAPALEAEGPVEPSDGEATAPEMAVQETMAIETGDQGATVPEDEEIEVVAPEVAEEVDGGSPELETAVKKAAKGTGRDRRQHARFVVGGRTKGRVTAIYDARILDISPGGSLIEHSQVVRPGTLSCLDLDLLGKRMSLKCRVARSVVHRSEIQPDGDNELIYHTGLEFLDRSDETRRLIIDYIQSIIEDGNKR